MSNETKLKCHNGVTINHCEGFFFLYFPLGDYCIKVPKWFIPLPLIPQQSQFNLFIVKFNIVEHL